MSIVASILLSALALSAAPLSIERQWHEPRLEGAEDHGLTRADFDDDGLPDLAVAAIGRSMQWRIEGVDTGGAWTTKQVFSSAVVEPGIRELPVGWEVSGPDRLLILTSNAEVIEFRGWPLVEARRFPIVPGVPRAAAIADVDADGVDELVIGYYERIDILSLDSGAREWTEMFPAADVEIAQLDADAALEILIAGDQGIVLDGATRVSQWVYAAGFGFDVATGRFGADSQPWFAGVRPYAPLTAFRTSPWGAEWTSSDTGYESVATCDHDGDGRDEIAVAGGQIGMIRIYDAATHAAVRSIPHVPNGSAGVVAGDFDGVPGCEIAAASRPSIFYPLQSLLVVHDAGTGERLHRIGRVPGILQALAIDDLDVDGTPELVTANSYATPPVLRVQDAQDGATLWELGNWDSPLAPPLPEAHQIAVAQLDADPGREIVISGGTAHASWVTVVDSTSRSIQLDIGRGPASPLQHRAIRDARIFDLGADGQPDILLGTQAVSTGTQGAQLFVYSLADGELRWFSPPIGIDFERLNAAIVAQVDDDPSTEFLAVTLFDVIAFDPAGGIDWTLTSTDPNHHAAHDPVRGQLALASNDEIRIHDLRTRELLRRFPAGGTLAKMRYLPGPRSRLLALVDGRMRVFDGTTGMLLLSGPDMGGIQYDTTPAVWPDGAGWMVANANGAGLHLHVIEPNPDEIFVDNFES